MAYKNIPVDEETHQMILILCEAYDMGRRAQGAMVRKLAKAEIEKLDKTKLLPRGEGRKAEGGKAEKKGE